MQLTSLILAASTALAAVNEPCYGPNGLAGVCIDSGACSSAGGTSIAGACPWFVETDQCISSTEADGHPGMPLIFAVALRRVVAGLARLVAGHLTALVLQHLACVLGRAKISAVRRLAMAGADILPRLFPQSVAARPWQSVAPELSSTRFRDA